MRYKKDWFCRDQFGDPSCIIYFVMLSTLLIYKTKNKIDLPEQKMVTTCFGTILNMPITFRVGVLLAYHLRKKIEIALEKPLLQILHSTTFLSVKTLRTKSVNHVMNVYARKHVHKYCEILKNTIFNFIFNGTFAKKVVYFKCNDLLNIIIVFEIIMLTFIHVEIFLLCFWLILFSKINAVHDEN